LWHKASNTMTKRRKNEQIIGEPVIFINTTIKKVVSHNVLCCMIIYTQ
jgi:hypothetical protein